MTLRLYALTKKKTVRTSSVNLPCMWEATGQPGIFELNPPPPLHIKSLSHRMPLIEPLHDHLRSPCVCSPPTESTPSSPGLPRHFKKSLSPRIYHQVLCFLVGLFICTLGSVYKGFWSNWSCLSLSPLSGCESAEQTSSCSSLSHHHIGTDSSLSHHTGL